MTEYPAGRGHRSGDLTPGLRLAALTAVIIGVVLLAAAAFLLSYSGIHHIALQAGVSPKLARLYPGIFDAMLVIASAAVLALRGAGWLTRAYVWLCLIALLAAVATGDAVHAMGVALPRQPARAGVAITPWALVLLSFGMLLAMLRHLRRARAASRAQAEARPAEQPRAPGADPAAGGAAREGADSLLEPRTGEPPALPTAEHSGQAGAGDHAAAAAHPASASYAPGGYFPAAAPDESGEYLETEEYGMEDYAETEEYQPDAGHAGGEHGGEGTPGQPPGAPAGEQDGQHPAGPAMPASAPLAAPGPFDRMRSSPTRPED
jgi:hypothetical protein